MADSGKRIPDILSRLAEGHTSFQQAAQSLRAAFADGAITLSDDEHSRLLEPLLKVLSDEEFAEIIEILRGDPAETTLDVTLAPEPDRKGTTLDLLDNPNDVSDAFQPLPESRRFKRIRTITRPNGEEYWLAKDLNAQRDVLFQPADVENQNTLTAGQLVGGLEHPNIAPVYSIITGGEAAGVIYRFNAGTPLSDWISDAPVSPLTLRQALNLVVSLCDALSYAHSKEIAHGSVKSDNVIVGEFHEVQLESWECATVDTTSQVMLQDIDGLLEIISDIQQHFSNTPQVAKAELRLLARFRTLTASGSHPSRFQSVKALRDDLIAWLHRTPMHNIREPLAYRGMRFLLKYRKAVFATLVVMLVTGATFLSIASGVRDARLLLNQTNSRLEQQQLALSDQITKLDTAIEQANTEEQRAILATNAAHEQQLLLIKETKADDIAAEELRLATLELVKQTELSTIASKKAALDAEKARDAANAAKSARDELTIRQYESNEVQAQDAITDGIRLLSNEQPTHALAHLVFAAERLRGNPATPRVIALNNEINSEIAAILRETSLPSLTIPVDGTSLALRFDPHAKMVTRVATQGDNCFIETKPVGTDSEAIVFQIEPDATQAVISTNLRFASVIHANGSDTQLITYSIQDQTLLHKATLDGTHVQLRVSNAGDTAIKTSSQTLSVLTRKGELFYDAIQHGSRISDFQFSGDSNRIATASIDKTARIWETSSALPLTGEIAHPTSVAYCTFAHKNSLLTVTASGSAFRWDISAYNAVGSFFTGPRIGYKNRIVASAWNITRDEFALGTANNYLHVYRNDGRLRFQPRRFAHPLTSIRFSADSRLLIVTDQLGQVHLINAQSGEALRHPTPPYTNTTSIALTQENDRLLVHSGNSLQVWNLYLSVMSPRFETLPFTASAYLSSHLTNDSIVVSNTGQLARLLLKQDTGTPVIDISDSNLDISPPLRVIRSGIKSLLTDSKHKAYLFSANAFPNAPITQHAAPITGFSVSTDGRFIATASEDRTIHLVDLATGEQVRRLDWFGAAVHQVTFLTDKLLYIEAEAKSNPETVLRQIYDINTTKLSNLPPSPNFSETISSISPTLAAYAFVTRENAIPNSHIQLFHSETGVLQETFTISGEVVGIQPVEQFLFVITRDGRLLRIALHDASTKQIGTINQDLTDLVHSNSQGLLVIYSNIGATAVYDLKTQHLAEIVFPRSGNTQLLRSGDAQHPILFNGNTMRIYQPPLRSQSSETARRYLSAIDFSDSDPLERQSSVEALNQQIAGINTSALQFDWITHNAINMPLSLARDHFDAVESGQIIASTDQQVTAAVNAGSFVKAIQLLDEALEEDFNFRQVFLKSAILRLDDRHSEADRFLETQIERAASASPADMLLFLNAVALSQSNRKLHESAYQLYEEAPAAVKKNVTVVRAAALLALRLSNTAAYETFNRQLQNAPNKIILAPLDALALSLGYLDSSATRQNLSRLASRLPFTDTHNLQQLSPELLLFELIYKSLRSEEVTR